MHKLLSHTGFISIFLRTAILKTNRFKKYTVAQSYILNSKQLRQLNTIEIGNNNNNVS